MKSPEIYFLINQPMKSSERSFISKQLPLKTFDQFRASTEIRSNLTGRIWRDFALFAEKLFFFLFFLSVFFSYFVVSFVLISFDISFYFFNDMCSERKNTVCSLMLLLCTFMRGQIWKIPKSCWICFYLKWESQGGRLDGNESVLLTLGKLIY